MRADRISAGGGSRGEIAAVAALCILSVFAPAPVLAAGVGIACLVWRPSCGGWLGAVLLALALAPLLALLPPLSQGGQVWLPALGAAGYSLTPQPRVLLSLWPTYLSAVIFLWWICGRGDENLRRRRQLILLLVGSLLSLLLVAGRWESGDWRGPTAEIFRVLFPTRNQAAGLAAVVFAGCVVQALRERRRGLKVAWLAGCAAGLLPLLTLGSRGALGAALAGCAAGGVLLLARVGEWRRVREPVVGVLILAFVGGALFLMAPLPLSQRFASEGVGGLGMRLAIQQDAWSLAAEHPLTGVGLGSFEDVFPLFRVASAMAVRANHPESDWLWLVCESGFLAGLLAWAVAILLAVRCIRLGQNGAVGLAALAAVAAHGLLDVPAHSLPIFFLVAALAGSGGGGRSTCPATWPAAIGLILAAWLFWEKPPRPAPFAPHRSMNVGSAGEIDRWLRYRPLDLAVHELALHRAIADRSDQKTEAALRRVLHLDPMSTELAMRAFRALAPQDNGPLCAVAVQAILERTPPGERAARLEELIKSSTPGILPFVLEIPPGSAAAGGVRILSLGTRASEADFRQFLNDAAKAGDPGVALPLAARVLALADNDQIIFEAEKIPALARPAGAARARKLAAAGDYASACQAVTKAAGLTDRQILESPATPDAIRLALQQLRGGEPARARALAHAAEQEAPTSRGVWYVLGSAELALGDPGRAWMAFDKYLNLEEVDGNGQPGPR